MAGPLSVEGGAVNPPPTGAESQGPDVLPEEGPVTVARPAMLHRWDRLTFIHWPYPAPLVRRLLPDGLEVHAFGGAAWVGIIPFVLRVRVPAWAPPLPLVSRFVEVNVRTYVRGPGGLTGIWFLSLDAPRLFPVLVARTWYRIPYAWASMRFAERGGTVRYETRRRWPGPQHPAATIVVKPGARLRAGETTDLDRFLTARFRLWSPARGGLARTEIAHLPWDLQGARLMELQQDLLEAVGLPRPEGEPLVRYSRAMAVRLRPRRVVADVGVPGLPETGRRSEAETADWVRGCRSVGEGR